MLSAGCAAFNKSAIRTNEMVVMRLRSVRETGCAYMPRTRSAQNDAGAGEMVERAVDRHEIAIHLAAYFVDRERVFGRP